jgi:hypothetical protein
LGLALILALCMLAPAASSASTGSIEGVTVEPSLAHASVQNLAVNYGGCRRIWSLESTGDGGVQSGSFQPDLEADNDEHLCLYASDQPPPPPYAPGPPGSSELLASQLLHVDQPVRAPNTLPLEVEMGASGETVPAALPRSQPVPITLRVGFTSEDPNTHTAPELNRIAIDVSRNVTFQTKGLPSCPIANLYASVASARQSCAGSLVGHGSVTSEVALPGQPPTTIDGHLLAFYGFAEGQPRILAQVTSGGALPLTYVIPFQIEKAHGPFGTSLVVRKMTRLQGVCERAPPNCFAQPYTLKGVYGHISNFELSLHRRFTHASALESFVSADCPAKGRQSVASFQLGVSLRYDLGFSLGGESATLLRRCKVAN